MRYRIILPSLMLATGAAGAQQGDSVSAAPLIQDNSFLVEEAYNQEGGIVQHIMTLQKTRGSSDFEAAFTQEWPAGSIKHQLSYDLPLARTGGSTGIGDVSVNYRYQLTGDGNTRLAIAPRMSIVLPTGDWKRSRGYGTVGLDAGIPISYVLSPFVVTHINPGVAVFPSARNAAGQRSTISELSYGQSLIFTGSSFVQPMLEAVYARGEDVIQGDATQSIETFVIAPGVRAAFNFASGLQIVPGVSFPIGAGPSSGERGVFAYLSFEHAFRK